MSKNTFYINYNTKNTDDFLANNLINETKYSKQYTRQQLEQNLFVTDNSQHYTPIKKTKNAMNIANSFKSSLNVIKHRKNKKISIAAFHYRAQLKQNTFLKQTENVFLSKRKKNFGTIITCNKGGALMKLTKNLEVFVPKSQLKKNYFIQQQKNNKIFLKANKNQFFYYNVNSNYKHSKFFFIINKINHFEFFNFSSLKTKKRKNVKQNKILRNLNAIALYKKKLKIKWKNFNAKLS